MTRFTPIPALIALLVLASLFLSGCGRKGWPEPMAESERFSFSQPTGSLREGCLEVRVLLRGKSENLNKLELELAPSGEDADCPTCPFRAKERVEVPLDAPNLEISKRSLLLTQCGLEPDRAYRWRLVGHSSYPGIAPVSTQANYTEP